ncbi:uncharacterized protein HMPREF1541_03466 [Cyphellophora europaea CBS 101466]|uniref:Heterokaryon incompatibility domain-containing protein n=1 Tax=Cyphellophora europaea (strain CBS 101466) TaxID=1220924 RepID=W2RYX2_CYPE1|nr:uncharacterized protein HMPREF1541_03466 [Cyphellophora europaea CBS 101466]ETN41530.1 hypothetical protein HMPREF1541_03466 [Cyphellophora europaea CBS 101466]
MNGAAEQPGSAYSFDKLPDNSTYIRLARLLPAASIDDPLKCQLGVHLRGEAPPYEAISYVCGDPNDTRPIMVDGSTLPIYATLATALQHIRLHDRPRVIWADAICIHQADDLEKSYQVQGMYKIYQRSKHTIAWLDYHESNGDFQRGMRLLEHLGSGKYNDLRLELQKIRRERGNLLSGRLRLSRAAEEARLLLRISGDSPLFSSRKTLTRLLRESRRHSQFSRFGSVLDDGGWEAVSAALHSSYFERLWIWPELAFSEEASFVSNNLVADVHKVLLGYGFVETMTLHDDDLNGLIPAGPLFFAGHYLADTAGKKQKHPPGSEFAGIPEDNLSLLALMKLMRDAKCADPRDRLFAMETLTSDPLNALNPPDYTLSASAVFKRFVRTYIELKKDFSVLSFGGVEAAPSWIPTNDEGELKELEGTYMTFFIDDEHLLGLDGRDPLYRAAASTTPRTLPPEAGAEDDTLSVYGYKIDQIVQVHRCRQSKTDSGLKIDPDILQSRAAARRAGHKDEDFWRTIHGNLSRRFNYLDDEFEETLAKLSASNTNTYPSLEFRSDLLNSHDRFVVTERGRIGTVPDNSKLGDIIVVFFGAQMPYVLRPTDKGNYLLVEECYLNKCMDGETYEEFSNGKYEEKVFHLV